MESVRGLKSRRPAMVRAVTSSGEVTNACVLALPSLRLEKLRLYDVTIVLGVPAGTSERFHWPMHGPQALASTVPPAFSNTSIRPSRATVARTFSEPGVTSYLRGGRGEKGVRRGVRGVGLGVKGG